MPIDPGQGFPTSDNARLRDDIKDLDRRLRAVENGAPTIQTGTAAPSTTPRAGTPYGQDSATGFFWLYIGGTWRKVALT